MPKVSATIRRNHLADRVRKRDHRMPSPCGACRRASKKCLVDALSGYCARCLEKHLKCDLVVTEADWGRLDQACEKVEKELKDTVAQVFAAEESCPVLLSKQLRLLEQLELLDRREKEMFARELSSIKELEKLEQENAQNASPSSNTAVDSSVAEPSLSPFLGPMSPAVPASLGDFDATQISWSPFQG